MVDSSGRDPVAGARRRGRVAIATPSVTDGWRMCHRLVLPRPPGGLQNDVPRAHEGSASTSATNSSERNSRGLCWPAF